MDFETLLQQVEADEGANAKVQRTGKAPINEQKLFELEKEIEANFDAADKTKKGCFGALVRLADSEICQACKDGAECEAALLAKGKDKMAEAEKEIEAIVADNQLKGEMASMAEAKPKKAEIGANPILQQIYDVVDKVLGTAKHNEAKEPDAVEKEVVANEDKPKEPVEAPESISSIDLSYLGKRTKVPFDFNKAKDLIMSERPSDYKRVRQICLGLVEDTFQHGSTAYSNAKKIMAALQDLNALAWDAEAKKIVYNL